MLVPGRNAFMPQACPWPLRAVSPTGSRMVSGSAVWGMRRRPWFVSVALTLVMLISLTAASSCRAASDVDHAILEEVGTIVAEILGEIEDFNEAGRVGDVDRILSHIADDATLVTFVGHPQTKAEYVAALKQRMEDPSTREIILKYRAIKFAVP